MFFPTERASENCFCLCERRAVCLISPERASVGVKNMFAVCLLQRRAWSHQGWAATARRGVVTGDVCRYLGSFWQRVCFFVCGGGGFVSPDICAAGVAPKTNWHW